MTASINKTLKCTAEAGLVFGSDPTDTSKTNALRVTSDGSLNVRTTSPYHPGAINYDISGRTRVGQITTLFDGKTLNQEDTKLWSTIGTGTRTYITGAMNQLSVTAGQYIIRQSRVFTPYFSGKSHLTEMTFDNFAPQTGVTKRVGYFSSSATAPYSSNYDGWYLESSGGTLYLVVVAGGIEKLRKEMTTWDNYAAISSYNWDNFTIILVDFLWLGGAALRLSIKNPTGGFTVLHTFEYAGAGQGTFMNSPNQPVRYEVRSTTGTGSMRAVCCQVASEGSFSESGESLGVYNPTTIATNTVGTIYALKGVRKTAAWRDMPVRIDSFGICVTTADSGILMLLYNPTLSAPLTWVANSVVEDGTASAGQTVTSVGRVMSAIPVVSSGYTYPFIVNSLAWLGGGVNNVFDEFVLAWAPNTANQAVAGTINLIEY